MPDTKATKKEAAMQGIPALAGEREGAMLLASGAQRCRIFRVPTKHATERLRFRCACAIGCN